MNDKGNPSEPCHQRPEHTVIFSFPTKSPKESMTYKDYNSKDHLDLWLTYQKYWCDHKPSVTINYNDEDFMDIGQWVYNNWDWVSGISFLPHTDHVYEQAPFEAISEEEYQNLIDTMPSTLDWSELSNYEKTDTTTSSHSLACSGGSCDVVDLVGEQA